MAGPTRAQCFPQSPAAARPRNPGCRFRPSPGGPRGAQSRPIAQGLAHQQLAAPLV